MKPKKGLPLPLFFTLYALLIVGGWIIGWLIAKAI